jgi:DNA-binding MarR family transcriptional regulator
MAQLNHLCDVLDLALMHYREISISTLRVFLAVVQEPGQPQHWYADRLSMTKESVSRNLAALDQWREYRVEGLSWIVRETDPQNRRQRIVYITPKGQQVAQQIAKMLSR